MWDDKCVQPPLTSPIASALTIRNGPYDGSQILQETINAGGGILLILGPSGIGKSTLAAQLQNSTTAPSFAPANPDGEPNWPPLRTVATRPDIEPPLGLWNRLAASAASRNIPVTDTHDRFASALALLSAIGKCDQRPILFDDIHAADPDSLALLAQIAAVIPETGTTVIVTSRGADAIEEPLGQAAHHAIESQAAVITLTGFGREEVAERLRQHGMGASLSQEHATTYLLASAGNPLVLDHLIAATWSSSQEKIDPTSVTTETVGSSVVALWTRELNRLSLQDREVLGIISELGGHARQSLISQIISSLDRGETSSSLERLIAHGLVATQREGPLNDERITLAHPAISEALNADRRALTPHVHQTLAHALNEVGAEPRLVLMQMLKAGQEVSTAQRRAVALQVARHAEEAGDLRAAAEAWDVVIANRQSDAADRLAAAEAWHQAGERTRSRGLAREVTQLTDPDQPEAFSRAAILFADGAEFHGEAVIAVALLHRATELLENLLGDNDNELARRRRVELLSALAPLEMTMPTTGPSPGVQVEVTQSAVANMVRWHWVTRPEVSQPQAVAAEDAAEALGDPVLIATTGLVWRLTHQAPHHATARRQRSERARRVLVDHAHRSRAVHAVLLDALEAGEHAKVQIALGELADLATGTGDPTVRWRYLTTTSMLERLSAKMEAAEHHSSLAGTYGALAGEPTAVIVRVEQRTVIEAERLTNWDAVRSLGAQLDSVQHPPLLAGVLWLLSELQVLDVPHTAVSLPVLNDLVTHLATPRSHEQNWMCTVGFTSAAVARMGHSDLAARMLELLEPCADQVIRESSGVIALGYAHRLRGELQGVVGAVDEAATSFEIARHNNTAAGFTWAVLAGEIAELRLLAQWNRITPVDLRSRAFLLAQHCAQHGLHLYAAQARRLGATTEARVLPERQKQILAGLVSGSTYQQIADSIGYSHGTVRGEVSKLYTDLGVDSREEAVVEAEWRGLLPASSFGWGSSKN